MTSSLVFYSELGPFLLTILTNESFPLTGSLNILSCKVSNRLKLSRFGGVYLNEAVGVISSEVLICEAYNKELSL